jgi:ATP-dependent RNA helicase DeaD
MRFMGVDCRPPPLDDARMTDALDTTFDSLGLPQPLIDTLDELGYEAPTPIQARTIPALLAGKDLIGQAQTGTGKTAAFALPLLAQLDMTKKATQALILTPTRELAMQVAEALHTYAKKMPGVTVLPVYGGAPIVLQMKHLQRGAQIVVGTPGRLIDHLDRGTLDLGAVRMVVLDEADEMLKMGFVEEVERMLSLVPKPRQVALFSATMPEPIVRIADRHLVKPVRVEIEHKGITALAIEQRFLNLAEGQKLEVLTQILELEPADAVLIFRRTKNGAAELAEKLEARGFAAVPMHGDMKQAERESVIRRLRGGQIEIVVATDVAARGLDVEQITHVVNYDIPHDVEAYVHRIGRTGRAGRSGVATLFITPRERRMMREIEKFTGTQIKPMKIPTSADVAARRISVLKETLRKEIADGELDLYVDVVTQLAEEGPFDMAEIAAAAARIAHGARATSKKDVEAAAAPSPPIRSSPATRPSPATRAARPASADAAGDSSAGAEKTRLSMAVGKRDGIRPADVVGSIANEADIPGSDIGPIDIRDDITYVVIPTEHVERVLDKVGRAKFKGRPVGIRVAEGYVPQARFERSSPRPPARPYTRPQRDGAPPYRREGAPAARREGAPAPRREGEPVRRPAGAPARREGAAPYRREGAPPFRREGAPPRRDRPSGPPKGGAFNRFARPTKPAGGPKKKR